MPKIRKLEDISEAEKAEMHRLKTEERKTLHSIARSFGTSRSTVEKITKGSLSLHRIRADRAIAEAKKPPGDFDTDAIVEELDLTPEDMDLRHLRKAKRKG